MARRCATAWYCRLCGPLVRDHSPILDSDVACVGADVLAWLLILLPLAAGALWPKPGAKRGFGKEVFGGPRGMSGCGG